MKYLGGKQRLGKHLAPVLKELWNYVLNATETPLDGYMEPFCGSLGVFRNMTNLTTDKFIANDYHPDLIQMWTEVKNETFVYPESVSEEEYLAAKKLSYQMPMSELVEALKKLEWENIQSNKYTLPPFD